MASLGRLTLDLVARTGGFTGPLERARKRSGRQFRDIQRSAKSAAAGIAAVTAAAAAAATGLYMFAKSGMDAIDAQAKLARQLDSSIGGLRGLQLAANDAGVSTGVINSAMERFSARLGEAMRGTGQAKDALDRLGLSARELAGADVNERVAAIADRVHDLGLSGAETADVLRQFGIRNREIVNLMRQGGDAIRSATQEVEDYGLAIDSVDAAAIEAANDALSRVGLVMESIQQTLAVELAPMILVAVERFNAAAREAGGFGNAVSQAVETSLIGLGELLDTYQEWRILNQRVVVATKDMELAFARFAASAWTSVSGFLDKWARGMNNIIAGLRHLPGMGDLQSIGLFSESDFLANIEERMARALGARNIAALDLGDLIDEGSYRQKLEEFLADVEARRDELAETLGGGLPGLPGTPGQTSSSEATRAIDDQARALQGLLDSLYPVKAMQREFAMEQAMLAEAFGEGTDEYVDVLGRLEEKYRSGADAAQVYGFLGIGGGEDQDGTYWEQWLAGAEEAMTSFDEIAGNVVDRFSSRFGDAFEAMIFDAQSLGDAIHGLADGMLRSVVNALGKMAAEWLAYQAVQLLVGRTTQASAATTQAMNAQAMSQMAGLNAFASTAAIPVVGPVMAPGAMAAAIAATQPVAASVAALSYAGMAHDGIDSVPSEGTWLLDKGERVMTRPQANKLDAFLARQQLGGGGGVTVNVIEDSRRAGQQQERTAPDGRREVDVFVADIMGDGPRSQAIRNKFGLQPQGR